MKEIEEALSNLGLSKNEIKTYIALVRFGQLSALDCSKQTEIHRSNCYDSLNSLLEGGFVSQVMDGSRMVFIAREPEVLKDYLKEQERELDIAVQELNNLSSELKEKDGVKISTGLFSVRESLNACESCTNSSIEVYGLTEKIIEKLGEGYFQELERKLEKQKNDVKIIGNFQDKNSVINFKKSNFVHYRFVSEKFYGQVITVLSEGKVTLYILSELPLVIEIKNKEVYYSYKRYFEILWKKARD